MVCPLTIIVAAIWYLVYQALGDQSNFWIAAGNVELMSWPVTCIKLIIPFLSITIEVGQVATLYAV